MVHSVRQIGNSDRLACAAARRARSRPGHRKMRAFRPLSMADGFGQVELLLAAS